MQIEEAKKYCKQIKDRDLWKVGYVYGSEAIETVLNELEKKDRQLEEKTNRINNLEKECQRHFDNMMDTIQDNTIKDTVIDEMAKQLYIEGFCREIKCMECTKEPKDCIKQYFYKKAEEK